MPIVVDYSNVSIAAIMAMTYDSKVSLSSDICKHAVLNSLRRTNIKFREGFGQMIIVCDDSNDKCWRYGIYPPYKYKRKMSKKADGVDWDMVNAAKDYVQTGMIDAFPFPVIAVSTCEADDIIGWFALNATEPTVIVGNDKDYHQCHSDMVCQWKPAKQVLVRYPDPKRELKRLLIKGDTDDGVPNIRSVDEVFMDPSLRQTSIFEKDLNIWLDDAANSFLITEHIKAKKVKGVMKPERFIEREKNFKRNQSLIDFNFIPDHLKIEIMERMTKYQVSKNRNKCMSWLAKHKMKYLMERFNDFF